MSNSNLFSIKDKVVIITGATKGIGKSIAEGLAKEHAIVYGLGRSCEDRDHKANLFYRKCDVTSILDFERICNEIYQKHSRLDSIINNAGITVTNNGDGLYKCEDWIKTINTNLTAAFNCIQISATLMEKKGGGSIINITSIGAELAFPNNPAYVASKGGLKMLTKAFARDLGRKSIRVNNIGPGYIRTDMTEESFQNEQTRIQREQNIILGRWGAPEDLIGPCIFLLSKASGYITGQDLYVDGGWTANGLQYFNL
jgi:NAD(P)-dependent dehydrogenase (short-subunit alcohol dehydrogenase family)